MFERIYSTSFLSNVVKFTISSIGTHSWNFIWFSMATRTRNSLFVIERNISGIFSSIIYYIILLTIKKVNKKTKKKEYYLLFPPPPLLSLESRPRSLPPLPPLRPPPEPPLPPPNPPPEPPPPLPYMLPSPPLPPRPPLPPLYPPVRRGLSGISTCLSDILSSVLTSTTGSSDNNIFPYFPMFNLIEFLTTEIYPFCIEILSPAAILPIWSSHKDNKMLPVPSATFTSQTRLSPYCDFMSLTSPISSTFRVALTFFEFSVISFTLKFVGVVSIVIPCFYFNFLHPFSQMSFTCI